MPASVAPKILVANGPNLNLLGKREPHLYGTDTLEDAERLVRSIATEAGVDVDFFQTNYEGALVDRLHEARESAKGIIINPAGFTSTSITLLDALLATDLPVVEVHVTNIHRREEFRHHSYVSKAADAVIAGAGIDGYGFATHYLVKKILAKK
jgi:3-dehydroquinate dehydratase II